MSTTTTERTRGIYDTGDGRCDSHLNVRGEDFRCDLATDHNGWAHSSRDAEALWAETRAAGMDRDEETDR